MSADLHDVRSIRRLLLAALSADYRDGYEEELRTLTADVGHRRGEIVLRTSGGQRFDIIVTHNPTRVLSDALAEWKCPSCGGKGAYQQNAVGRARTIERGGTPDPVFEPTPVKCKVCDGSGLHPKASAALALARHGGTL